MIGVRVPFCQKRPRFELVFNIWLAPKTQICISRAPMVKYYSIRITYGGECMKANIKTHISGIKIVLHYYLMGVALSWAAFPVICIVSLRLEWNVDIIQKFYSIFAMLLYTILAYIGMHGFGESDRRPYKWARYKMKGFVCGAVAFLIIYCLECIAIALANKYFIVEHPYLAIEGINAYITQILYMPFFWFYELLSPASVIIPPVNYLTGLAPLLYITAVAGFAYLMGYSNKYIIKKKPNGKLAQFLFYRKPKEKKSWKERLRNGVEVKK